MSSPSSVSSYSTQSSRSSTPAPHSRSPSEAPDTPRNAGRERSPSVASALSRTSSRSTVTAAPRSPSEVSQADAAEDPVSPTPEPDSPEWGDDAFTFSNDSETEGIPLQPEFTQYDGPSLLSGLQASRVDLPEIPFEDPDLDTARQSIMGTVRHQASHGRAWFFGERRNKQFKDMSGEEKTSWINLYSASDFGDGFRQEITELSLRGD
ncbi:hypothetical protein IAR55_005350 [Kwoniella newhampshirensis]|uniref:Uncharacterized protein n=1 Tax=Kwoniella newhampshirensis TaxID=1651941 RepID=A0AAW0YVC8_9TREE